MNTNAILKLLMPIVALSIIILIFPVLLNGSDNILRETQADTSTDIVAPAGSGTVPLSQPLYASDVDWVTTITSSSGTDTPVAGSWSLDVLTITGLTWVGSPAAGTRTIVTTYEYDQVEDYTGLGDIIEVAPLILWVSVVVGYGAVAFAVNRRKQD